MATDTSTASFTSGSVVSKDDRVAGEFHHAQQDPDLSRMRICATAATPETRSQEPPPSGGRCMRVGGLTMPLPIRSVGTTPMAALEALHLKPQIRVVSPGCFGRAAYRNRTGDLRITRSPGHRSQGPPALMPFSDCLELPQCTGRSMAPGYDSGHTGPWRTGNTATVRND